MRSAKPGDGFGDHDDVHRLLIAGSVVDPRILGERVADSFELEAETLKFFALDPASRASIPVSARLKEARELIDQKTNEGATLLLLEARLTLSRQQASKDEPAPASTTTPPDTLLTLWQYMATDEQPDIARYIRRDVIPLYTTIVRSGS